MNKKEKGVATVEFALVAMLFFTVFFAIIDFAYLFWGNLSMQHAVREGARWAVTGQPGDDPTPLTPPTPEEAAQYRCEKAKATIRDQSMGFYDRAASVVTFQTINAVTGVITDIPANCGGANDIIVISVANCLPPLTPFLKPFFTDPLCGVGYRYRFIVKATMKNEGF